MEKSTIAVFYSHKMVTNIDCGSPSPRKPKEVVESWLLNNYKIEIHDFVPVTIDDFYLAHKKEQVDGLINLSIANGIDTKDQELIDSLYWTSGSMFAAAKYSLHHKIAISPTSGFHHAGYDYAWGFCTLNGLLVTALKLIKEENIKKIGILDFDYHQGDGSEDIINKLNLSNNIIHLTGKTNYTRKKLEFFQEIDALLEKLKGVEVILYQAGSDQHENDPLGGFLNNEELRLRDRIVFNFAYKNNIPIVWNFAGGYQEEINEYGRSIQKILDIHNGTLEECLNIYLNKKDNI